MDNHWGDLFDSFVDAALHTEDDSVSREEILACIDGGTLVPGRYMYSSDLGAKNWIRLCNEPMYRHQHETVAFWANSGGQEIAKLVHEHIDGDDLDYVSLGPGDGEKDAELIGHWLGVPGMDIFYYPYDISNLLVSKAVRTVRERVPKSKVGLRIKAVLADFNHLNAVSEVFAHRESPNVIALLNSLGNLSDERKFLQRLRSQMSDKDLLVLEVRLRQEGQGPQDELSELIDGHAALRFDFGALESYLGVPFEADKMVVKHGQPKISSIADTATTIVSRTTLKFQDRDLPDARLIYIHQYEEQAFLKALGGMGFEVLKSMRSGKDEEFLVCVARRKRTIVERITRAG
ncbi:MAG TPA: L-histidine N(alpha)-methyltransferase [Solirubrobacterales bacterium]|jgi:hypothetical protein|nr:L-histidine N(alpha)-methyltransferase [Solirubrobacterales bacterium]